MATNACRCLTTGILVVFALLVTSPAMACDTAAWNGGSVGTVTANGKPFEGSCGAKFNLASKNLLVDLTPDGEKTYIVSFYVFLGEMSMGPAGKIVIFTAEQALDEPVIDLRIDRVGTDHRLVLVATDDNGIQHATTPVATNYGWNHVQAWWSAATGPGLSNGFANLRLNGVDKPGLASLDTDLRSITQARIGRIGGVMDSPGRFFDLDLFESRRSGGWTAAYNPFSDVGIFGVGISALFASGITGGCGGTLYCTNQPITRAQMAVFSIRAKLGSYHTPPPLPPGGSSFADVTTPFPTWIEEFYNLGITGGCATNPLRFCPSDPVTRGQMAVFILRSIEGSSYTPPPLPPGGSSFSDVTTFATWIEELYQRDITAGCGGTKYCPNDPVTRGQMAAFIRRGFELPRTAGVATNSQ